MPGTSDKEASASPILDKPTNQTEKMSMFMRAFYSTSKADVTTTSGDFYVGQPANTTSQPDAVSGCDMSPMARRNPDDVTPSLSSVLGGWLTASPKRKSGVTVRDVNVWAPVSM